MSAIQIQIEDKTHALKRLADQLSDKKITVANVRAINTAIRGAKTQYRRDIVKIFNLKYADTKDMVVPKRATYTTPEGKILGATNPISLSRFNPQFVKSGSVFSIMSVKNKQTGKRGLEQRSKRARKRDTAGGVTIEIHKGQKKNLPFAFLVNSDKPGLSQQIWARGKYVGNKFETGKKRMPIAALKSVAPFGMMTKEEVSKNIKKTASADMVKEFERQVHLLLKRAGAK